MPRPPLTTTYRIQMNARFTLAQARERIEYFARLGISHLYLSPIFAARRGSMHGYDVVDPTRVNPEVGTEADLRALAHDLHARGMGLMLDVVPNHMGIGPDNAYWDDVLTHGERSRYARWFDIDWKRHKLILPVLADDLERILERGELSVRLIEGETPRIVYFTHSFPVDPASLPPALQLAQVDPEEAGGLAAVYSSPEGRDRLRELLASQHYELVFWRRGATEINYRRFFDVNDLVALRMEDPAVFHETHDFVLRLVREGVVDALRIDHIDGLRRPTEYLERLRAETSPDTPIFVEKILAPTEQLPVEWPVQGTTGYEFLNDLDDALIDPAGFDEIDRRYRRMRRFGGATFHDFARQGKVDMLHGPLRADVERLVALFAPLARAAGHRWTGAETAEPLVQLIASLPVYRTYVETEAPIFAADRAVVEGASRDARDRGADVRIVEFTAGLITGDVPAADVTARLRFVERLQQLSGPATAKGVEDTALYAYVPLASRNEVGGAPDRPLESAVQRLHDANTRRAERWPHALLATNTHDTKRSADVRARLDALSEMPHEWERSVRRWRRLNDKHRQTIDGRMAPDTNSEYLLYQTLIALWPAPRASRRSDDVPDRTWRDSARERISRYMLKAAREAKSRTSWVDPDAAYEAALDHFIAAILRPDDDAPFLPDVSRLVSLMAMSGAYNALARIAIHLTSPGTPDIYQGDEFWNYTLVDPDNRRAVDYDARAAALADIASTERHIYESGAVDPFDNRVKMLVTHRLLGARRAHAGLFTRGSYRPLSVRGARANHVIAFARSFEGRTAVTIVPRLVRTLFASNPSDWWGDSAVELPDDMRPDTWHSQIIAGEVSVPGAALQVASILGKLPVALIVS